LENSLKNATNLVGKTVSNVEPAAVVVGGIFSLIHWFYTQQITYSSLLCFTVGICLANALHRLWLKTSLGLKLHLWCVKRACDHLSKNELDNYKYRLKESLIGISIPESHISKAAESIESAVSSELNRIMNDKLRSFDKKMEEIGSQRCQPIANNYVRTHLAKYVNDQAKQDVATEASKQVALLLQDNDQLNALVSNVVKPLIKNGLKEIEKRLESKLEALARQGQNMPVDRIINKGSLTSSKDSTSDGKPSQKR
jgi:hypothetical protein